MGEEDLPMTWRHTEPMKERLAFVAEFDRGERTMSELCRVFNVSRKTGYKWVARHHEQGDEREDEDDLKPGGATRNGLFPWHTRLRAKSSGDTALEQSVANPLFALTTCPPMKFCRLI